MTLRAKAVDHLFQRLAATYCAAWDRSLGAAPVADVKAAWAHELSGFDDKLPMVAWALENLPERCPNVIEFKALCRRAPAPEAPRLPEPKADPERMKAELGKLGTVATAARSQAHDPRGWAKAILAKSQAGQPVGRYALHSAREVLGAR